MKNLPEEEKEFLNQFEEKTDLEVLSSFDLATYNDFEKRTLAYLADPKISFAKPLLNRIHQRLVEISLIYKVKKLTLPELRDNETEVKEALQGLKVEMDKGNQTIFIAYQVKKFYLSLVEDKVFIPSILGSVKSIIVI